MTLAVSPQAPTMTHQHQLALPVHDQHSRQDAYYRCQYFQNSKAKLQAKFNNVAVRTCI